MRYSSATCRHGDMLRIGHINLARGFGGGEQQTLNLMRELAAQGIRQKLLCRAPGRLSESALELGADVEYVRHWLGSHHHRHSVDLWHAHDGKAVYWAALQHKLRGTPYLITRRVDKPIKPNFIARAAYSNASYVACLSRAIEARVAELEPKTNRVIIPSSFSGFRQAPSEVSAIRARHPEKFLVGQVGSLLRHKGQHVTIEVARHIARELPQIHFLLLGDGPEREALEAAGKKLPNISLLGHQSNIGPYFAAFDLFIFPSLNEGLGSSILEAMQAGTPVLASRTGGIPDLIEHGQNGWLVSPGNATELAKAIAYLYHHPEYRQQLAAHASKGLGRYAPTAVASRYLDLYRAVASQ